MAWLTKDIKMQYFQTLPKVRYTDKNNVSTIYTNLMARASIINSMLDSATLFYDYEVQDGDTPEIVAYKYYGDINRFWIILYSNQINDPLWDWPLNSKNFTEFVDAKYGNNKDDIHHYEKIQVKTNRTSGTDHDIKTVTEVTIIDESEYNSLFASSGTTVNYTFSTGIVSVTTSVQSVTNYEYESKLNEDKRHIKILNKNVADQLENEFMKLMK